MTNERPTYCSTCILSEDQKTRNQYSCCLVVLRPDEALVFLLALWNILSAQCCSALLSILRAVKCGSSRDWGKFGCCEGDSVFESNWSDTDSSLLLTGVLPVSGGISTVALSLDKRACHSYDSIITWDGLQIFCFVMYLRGVSAVSPVHGKKEKGSLKLIAMKREDEKMIHQA